jgi:hypothetical protein
LIVPALSFAGSPTKQAKKELLTRVVHDIMNGACSRMYQMTTGEKTKKNTMIRYVSRKFRGISFGAPSLEDERCRVKQLVEFGPPFNEYEITFINGPFEGDMITYHRIDPSEGKVKFRSKKFGVVTATVYWMAGDCSIQNLKLSK